MDKRIRTAVLLTLAFSFIALWIAFVWADDRLREIDWPLSWLPPVPATILLIGGLFLAGLVVASMPGTLFQAGGSQTLMGLVAALVVVGAVLGLVPSLAAVLWGGLAWRRWIIVALALATVIVGSGRAMGCAVLAGLVWGAFGALIGLGRAPTEIVDLVLTGALVGVTLGAVGGTILKARRGPRDQDST